MQRIGVRTGLVAYLKDFWARREFAWTIAVGELRAQNQNTVLGNLWHLLNPLFLAGVYYLIFGVILNLGGGAAEDAPRAQLRLEQQNYPGFLIIGIFVFYFTQKVVSGGTRVVVSNMRLIQNINFPRALLPTASVLQESLAQLPALLAMVVIVYATGEALNVSWFLLLPILLIQSIFNLGMALIVARLTFHFRDTEFIIQYLMRIWFYLSGIFFSVELVRRGAESRGVFGEVALSLFNVNPAYAFITLSRDAVMRGTTNPLYWRYAILWAVGTFLFGFLFFRARELEYGRGS